MLLLDCGTFPTLGNGFYILVNSSNTTYGAPASVQCDTGYNSSIDAITCTENGTWSTTQCLAVGECVCFIHCTSIQHIMMRLLILLIRNSSFM